MTWFEKLTGFKEESAESVRRNIKIKGKELFSLVNSQSYTLGELETPTLSQLRKSIDIREYNSKIRVSEIVADVKNLHCQVENTNALFQVASQFNLLEMINPSITPEEGISRYESDFTQGPICSIACGAGTIYRNYFIELDGQIGQTQNKQIDCLDLIGKELNNEELNLWEMKNGYALANQNGLQTIDKKISQLSNLEREYLKGKLRTGIQWNTEVTISKTKHTVSQIYCSALPVAYSSIAPKYWESFARLILEALYESALYAAAKNMEVNKSNSVYLTLVGGGVFGNEEHWILESMQKAIRKFENVPLNVSIVSYGKSNPNLKKIIY